jgi:hypothetical protein
MSIENMIKNIGSGENVAAGKDFESVLADKMTSALNSKKIEMASGIGKTPVESEDNIDKVEA